MSSRLSFLTPIASWRRTPRCRTPRCRIPRVGVAGSLMSGLVVWCAVGCGPDRGPLEPYPVTGRVIVNGAPAKGCTVVLVPTDAELTGKVMPGGVTDEDGSFQLTTHETGDGAPAGEYQVTLRWEATKWPGMDDGGRMDPVKPEGPDRFQGRYARAAESGITVTIEPEPNELEPFRLDDVALLPGSE